MFGRKKKEKEKAAEPQVTPGIAIKKPVGKIAPPPDLKRPAINAQSLPQRWEHFCISLPVVNVADPNDYLQKMGAMGWELVSTHIVINGFVGPVREFYFKRPYLEDQPTLDSAR